MALSLDLRTRAIAAYHQGQGSVRTVAERFGIGHASLSRWIKRQHATGSPKRAPRSGGTPRRLCSEHEALLKAWLAEASSTPQRVLARRLHEATGVMVCQQTVGRAIARMGWTHKKSGAGPRSSSATT